MQLRYTPSLPVHPSLSPPQTHTHPYLKCCRLPDCAQIRDCHCFLTHTHTHTHSVFLWSRSDYGYMPANGLDGPCIQDPAVPLNDPCADGQVKTVLKSRGYRKVAGDVCVTGVAVNFEPYNFTCCAGGDVLPSADTNTTGIYKLSLNGKKFL